MIAPSIHYCVHYKRGDVRVTRSFRTLTAAESWVVDRARATGTRWPIHGYPGSCPEPGRGW